MCRLPGRGPLWRLLVLAVAVASLLGTGTARSPRPVTAQRASPTIGTQDVWLITRLQLTSADGTTSDATAPLLALADATPGGTVDLGNGLSFTDAPALTATALDDLGAPLPTIAVRVGVFRDTNAEDQGVPRLAIVSSPDFSQVPINLDTTSRIGLDFSTVPAAANLTGGTISYLFLQMLTPTDPAKEAGLDPAAILAQRWKAGIFQVLGAPGANGVLQPALVVDAPLTAAAPAPSSTANAAYAASTGSASFDAFGNAGSIFDNGLSSDLGRVSKQSFGPVGQSAAQFNNSFPQFCSPRNPDALCVLKIKATGTFDTPEMPTIGGHVHADIAYTAEAHFFGSGRVDKLVVQLDETYTPMGSAAGCSHVDLPSVPTPHIMGNQFHDGDASLSAPIYYRFIRNLQIADFIDSVSRTARVVGEGWTCSSASYAGTAIGAPALNNFVLPDRINLTNADTVYTGPKSFLGLLLSPGFSARFTTDSIITLSTQTLACSNCGTGRLDVEISFSEEYLYKYGS